jgi:CHASE2 domain-containing sensor protein
MQDKKEIAEVFFIALAAVSGCLGACTVASHRIISGEKIKLAFFVAYAIIGVATGLLFAAYGTISLGQPMIEIMAPSLIAGAGAVLLLSGTGASVKLVCKKLGFEIILQTQKIKDGDK